MLASPLHVAAQPGLEYVSTREGSAPAQLFLTQNADSPERRIRRVLVLADDKVTFDRRLSHSESEALAAGDWLALPHPGAQAATRIEVQHSHIDEAPMAHWQIEQRTLRLDDRSITLTLDPPRWAVWRSALQILDSGHDPGTRNAAFELKAGRPLNAAATMMSAHRNRALPWEARLLLAQARHQLDLDSQAALTRLTSQAPPDIAARASLELAEHAVQAGQSSRALQRYQQIGSALPADYKSRLQALALTLQQGAAPLELKPETLNRGDIMLAAYNRAARQGGSSAEALLLQLGSVQPDVRDELAWSVRDQANLVLGFSHLRHMRPALAHEAFARVRATGPYSSKGRLGLGWAQISPGGAASSDRSNPLPVGDELGEILRPRGDDATAQARRKTPFRTAHGVARGQRADDLQRALRVWSDLIGADPLDPAVQESMVAIAYALVHLGAFEDARARLDASVTQLEQIDTLLAGIDDQQLQTLAAHLTGLPASAQVWTQLQSGSRWWRRREIPQDFFLEPLLQDAHASAQLRYCRQLHQAWLWLSSAEQADLNADALHANQQCQQLWSETVKARISEWQRSTERYLGEARLALARLHDGQIDFSADAGDAR